MLEIICVVSFVTVCLCLSSIKFLKDYERLVIFRMGRVTAVRGPGPQIVWPFVETYRKFDLRIMSLAIEGVEIIARDHVPVSVSAVCYYQIADPRKTVLHVDDYRDATLRAVEAVFKKVLKTYQSSELSSIDKRALKALKAQIEPTVSTWGVRVTEFTISIDGTSATATVSTPVANSEAAVDLPGESVNMHSSMSRRSVAVSAETEAVALSTIELGPGSALGSHQVDVSREHAAGDEHLHRHDHAHHRKHKHSHFTFDHESYDFGHHSYEFGHENKPEQN